MNRTFKKYAVSVMCVVMWMALLGYSVAAESSRNELMEAAESVELAVDPTDHRWVGRAAEPTIEPFASEEVEVIETLDRTKPIYEVYKNGFFVADATAEVQWMIRDLSLEYDLPEKMIYGLITKESTFVPDEESFDGGCWGLAQINPFWITRANITHFTDDYRNRDLCDPYDNLLTLAEMMCYARDAYGLDYTTRDSQVKYLFWHATGKDPSGVTQCKSATRALGFADELVTLQS